LCPVAAKDTGGPAGTVLPGGLVKLLQFHTDNGVAAAARIIEADVESLGNVLVGAGWRNVTAGSPIAPLAALAAGAALRAANVAALALRL